MGNKAFCGSTRPSPPTGRKNTSQSNQTTSSSFSASQVASNTNSLRVIPTQENNTISRIKNLRFSPTDRINSITRKLMYCCCYSRSFEKDHYQNFSYMLENIQKEAQKKQTLSRIEQFAEYLTYIEEIIDFRTFLGKGNWYQNPVFHSTAEMTDQEKEMCDLSIKYYAFYQSAIDPHISRWLNPTQVFEELTLPSMRDVAPQIKQILTEIEPFKDLSPYRNFSTIS